MKRHPVLLGAHLSIAGGIHQALYEAEALKCNVLQIFTKNATTWKEKEVAEQEIAKFFAARENTGIDRIASHASYLINIAGPDPSKSAMSFNALQQELMRCSVLEIPFLILHPGSHMGEGKKAGIRRISERIHRLFSETESPKTRLLLETTAGQGASLGHSFEHLRDMIERINDISRIGVCLDTCHIFAAGYDISTFSGYSHTMEEFDRIIGLDNLYAIHLNDSKKETGSQVDRHEHIGLGAIGMDAFGWVMNDVRLDQVPKIIETPKKMGNADADPINLEKLRNLKK